MADIILLERKIDFLKKLLIIDGYGRVDIVMGMFEDIQEEIVILKTVYNIKDK
jgi:hypothetical protein